MLGLVGILALLIVLGLSLVITRIASTALSLTGLSYEAAKFQARSAFTGTGFTTSEAENIVNHPVRRRIVMILMILRSAGLVTIVISLILSFANTADQVTLVTRLAILIGGVVIVGLLAKSRIVDRFLKKIISRLLERWTDIDTRDYANLLHLSDEYVVTELQVKHGDWLEEKDLKTCNLIAEGIIVLGIQRRSGEYIGAPSGNTSVYSGDILLLYGKSKAIRNLDIRRSDEEGEQAHQQAVSEHRKNKREQNRKEKNREKAELQRNSVTR
ncbi:MAG: potassium transporter TrkA [candidate division Zixibacteria bacterium]|nr:potassium transporter TrkA [candidate division Zixibacteria bacterium]